MAIKVNTDRELIDQKTSTSYDACCIWTTESTLAKCREMRTDTDTGKIISDEVYYTVIDYTTHFNGVETDYRIDDEYFDSLPEAESYFNNRNN